MIPKDAKPLFDLMDKIIEIPSIKRLTDYVEDFPALMEGELKLDLSSDCQRFQTGLIFSQQHRPSRTDITHQTGFKKAVEGNAP